jgi:Coenzyme PQQ synthesis protein D (PqqD)
MRKEKDHCSTIDSKTSLEERGSKGGCMDKNVLNVKESDLNNLQVEVGKDLVCQELDGEMVLLDMQSGLYFGIDAVGTRIWQMLEEKVPPMKMVDLLLEEYEVEAEICAQQVLTFLLKLEKNNLLKRISI